MAANPARVSALVLVLALTSCASPPELPWTRSSYLVSEADFDRVWEASIVTLSTYFDGIAHVSKAERRIESTYYYPDSGLSRQKVIVRLDPGARGYVVRVRSILEALTTDYPPRWTVRGSDLKANDLLLDEIRRRAFGTAPNPAQQIPDQ